MNSCLTKREQEILDLAITGILYKEIAVKLNISNSTVYAHIFNIAKKRGLTSGGFKRVIIDELNRRLNEQAYFGA